MKEFDLLGSPSFSADLFSKPGWSDKSSLISSMVPETGAYCTWRQINSQWYSKDNIRYRKQLWHSQRLQFVLSLHLYCSYSRANRACGRYIPPWATSVPTLGSSTKTTSPNTDCAWSVIEMIPTPVESSKFTSSCSLVYFLTGKTRWLEYAEHLGSQNELWIIRCCCGLAHKTLDMALQRYGL